MPSSIFTSNYAAIGFVIAIVCFFISEQIGAIIIPRIRRDGAKVQRRNVGSNIIVYFSWIAVLGFLISFAKMGFALLPARARL